MWLLKNSSTSTTQLRSYRALSAQSALSPPSIHASTAVSTCGTQRSGSMAGGGCAAESQARREGEVGTGWSDSREMERDDALERMSSK